jgi:hypothetical protein
MYNPHTKLRKRIKDRLRRIANFLLLNASFTDNLGLLNGKMGIAIFFYNYSHYSGEKIFDDYAGELVDEIYEEINVNSPVDFANGLTGIGWGIEYLAENKFAEGDTDEALAEIDNVVYRNSIYSPFPLGSENDLFGHGLYFIARLREHGKDDNNLNTLFKKQHLIYLTDECERILVKRNFPDDKIQTLTIGSLNSFILFLHEIHKLDLFPVKVEKILHSLPGFVESCINGSYDKTDLLLLHVLIEKMIPIVIDNKIQKSFTDLAVKLNTSNISTTEDAVVERFIKNTWQKVIYRSCLSENVDFQDDINKVFSIIDNEENWNNRLKKLGNNDISLTGFAGLGLGLLKALTSTNKP